MMNLMQTLPYQRELLAQMKEGSMYIAILQRRGISRWHRDQKGDDRYWFDDYKINAMLIGAPSVPIKIPAEIGMVLCRLYYQSSRLDYKLPNPPGAILDPKRWNDDIGCMDFEKLLSELEKIQLAAHELIEIPWPRTASDYQRFYDQVLPEKILADFRLPPEPEFLGNIKKNASCPNFWCSHAQDKTCHYDQWGPCE